MEEVKIIKKIATGGMSTIYLGQWKGIQVVVKKLHPHLSSDKKFVDRFKREASILKDLNHKNIITFFDLIATDEDLLMILEYVDGETLDSLIKKLSFPPSLCVHIGMQIADGMLYAHSRGVIHRDLKPSNIIISRDGTLKITDFGLAFRGEFRFTDPGVYIGTPGYTAPEVISKGNYSPLSDVFSFGALMYELLSGKNPFEGKTTFETINNILYKNPRPLPRELNIPSPLSEYILSMLSKNPEKRPDFEKILKFFRSINILNRRDVVHFLKGEEINKEIKPIGRKGNKKLLLLLLFLPLFIIPFIFYKKEPAPPKNLSTNVITEDTVRQTKSESVSQQSPKPREKPETSLRNTPENAGSGYIKVVVKPWGKVYIDGKYIDDTPIFAPIKLKAGEHTIKAVNPETGENKERVNVKRNETLKVFLNLMPGYLKVKVKPWGYVYVDGKKVGLTPLAAIMLKSGTHRITVINPEYNEWSKMVEIPKGDTILLEVNLK